jgi:8-oxo-dGTP pyrophosphatase MutT (NUDIX family)
MVRLPPVLQPLPSRLVQGFPAIETPVTHRSFGMHPAGVLVLLFPREAEVRFLLTTRPDTLARHAGQISLPGGRREDHDGSLWDTACRETREELGIRTGRLVPLGRLDPVPVEVTGYLIWPFVAWSPIAPRITPDPREVAAVVEVSLASLLDPATVQDEEWEFRGASWRVTLYRFGDVAVWGATARVLADLASRLRPMSRAHAPAPGSVVKAARLLPPRFP